MTNKDKVLAYFDAYGATKTKTPKGWIICPHEFHKTISVWHVSWREGDRILHVEFDTRGRAVNALERDANRVAEARDVFLEWWQS